MPNVSEPLLMAYGSDDTRVPLVYGERFRDAVRKNNPNVGWVQYDGEQHGWHVLADNVDFLTRVDESLAVNLAAAHPPLASP